MDEVFAKLWLDPPSSPRTGLGLESTKEIDDELTIISFSKILTPSDANNGGGFSVPTFCSNSIFPPLDYEAEPPVQNISIWDVHGGASDFCHIYRGTPHRHLLTTGLSKFVNQKKLVARDLVVFMRNKNGELFVGLHRTGWSSRSADSGDRWYCWVKLEEGEGSVLERGRGYKDVSSWFRERERVERVRSRVRELKKLRVTYVFVSIEGCMCKQLQDFG